MNLQLSILKTACLYNCEKLEDLILLFKPEDNLTITSCRGSVQLSKGWKSDVLLQMQRRWSDEASHKNT